MRMYEILDNLRAFEEGEFHCYVNNSTILLAYWAIMLWAEKEEDLIPLLERIPHDQPELELFCIENRVIPPLEKNVAPVIVSHDCYT